MGIARSRTANDRRQARVSPSVYAVLLATAIFVVAAGIRLGTFRHAHLEHDERVYVALVEQLDAGRGYTLRGHSVLREAWVPADQYDRPLFYHPPGGVAIFWGFRRLAGQAGFGIAQLASFALFYWSTCALGWMLLPRPHAAAIGLVAIAAAFTPIVAHVHAHYWLDGPQLALATLAVLLTVVAVRRQRWSWAVAAGVAMAWAILTKLNAMLMLPVLAAVGWHVAGVRGWTGCRRVVLLTSACSAAACVAWLWVEWRAFGEWFPAWAGKPVRTLVETNQFIRYTTDVRSPWAYLRLLPQAMPTCAVALLAAPWVWADRPTRPLAAVLAGWTALVVVAHIALGYLGYAKLLRYVSLATPAMILLVALAADAAWRRLSQRDDRPWALALLGLLGLALTAEGALGVAYATVYAERAFIVLFPDLQLMGALPR